MTTSILNVEEFKKHLPPDLAAGIEALPSVVHNGVATTVSGQEFVDRLKQLFTPEQAEDLALRIEEGRALAHD